MGVVRFERIISVSSEDPVYCASNLLSMDTFRRWTNGKTGEVSISAIVQLYASVQISSIDIGNAGSAFVEVLGGAATDPELFEPILPASSFMSATDCREGVNSTRVRIFSKADFVCSEADKRWDRIKVVCSQPFVKDSKFGLSFLKIYSTHPSGDTKRSCDSPRLRTYEVVDLPPVPSLFSLRKKATEPRDPTVSLKPLPSSAFPGDAPPHSAVESKPVSERRIQEVDRPMDGVTFALSGYQNPRRAEIRDNAVRLGARYAPRLDSKCTHLVCAFKNTPKFEEAASLGIRIVNDSWVDECLERRSLIPVDRYLLTSTPTASTPKPPGNPRQNTSHRSGEDDCDNCPAKRKREDESRDSLSPGLRIPAVLAKECIYVDPIIESAEECKRIVLSYGGRLVDDLSSLEITAIISDQASKSGIVEMAWDNELTITAPVLSIGWLQAIHDTGQLSDKTPFVIRSPEEAT